jgi:hypothetical protein
MARLGDPIELADLGDGLERRADLSGARPVAAV